MPVSDQNTTDANDNTTVVGSGVAGTPAGGVLSVQGVSGGTGIPVDSRDGSGNALETTVIQGVRYLNIYDPGVDGTKPTYGASIVGLVVPASATDVFTITGSATKTIRVTRVSFSITTTAGSGAGVNVSLIKRSTANSGGTSTTPSAVPYDSNSAAATAVVRAYTANPTLGTTVGALIGQRYAVNVSNLSQQFIWDFGARPSQAIVLRGTSQVLSVNLNAGSVTGSNTALSVEWTEE